MDSYTEAGSTINLRTAHSQIHRSIASLCCAALVAFLGGCDTSTKDSTSATHVRGFDLCRTNWVGDESRELHFLDSSVATYRNSGNSYVLDYVQDGNNVVFTIAGNSKPDWTGSVTWDGKSFTLHKDEYTVTFTREP